jgi:arylsulfatase A-like enzyme
LRQEIEPADRCRHEAPWMAWVSFARPHQPYTPSDPYASMYRPGEIDLPPTGDGESPAYAEVRADPKAGPFDDPSLRNHVAAYLGCVSQVDGAIGLMLEELEQSGALENTVIVYASDHGDHAGEHGLYEKKHGIRARSICRVPMIVRFPRQVASGRACEEMVESVDVFPTLCELAGIDPPATVQGRSMTPLLGEAPRPIRPDALTENIHRKALATRRYRFVATREEERDELYDQQADPWELQNLIDSPDHAEVVRQMRLRLRQRLVEAHRPITAFRGGWLNHRYDEDGRLDPDSMRRVSPYD